MLRHMKTKTLPQQSQTEAAIGGVRQRATGRGLWLSLTRAKEAGQHVAGAQSKFGCGCRFDTHVVDVQFLAIQQMLDVHDTLGIEAGGNDAGGAADADAPAGFGLPIFEFFQAGTERFGLHNRTNKTLDTIDPVALDHNAAAYAVVAGLVADAAERFVLPVAAK